jgi:hypothetical protein
VFCCILLRFSEVSYSANTCYATVHVRVHPILSARTKTVPPSLAHLLHVLDKEKAGTIKEIISVREQDVNALQVSQHSQPAFEPFVVVVAARQAANFRSLLNTSYFW